VKATTSTDAPVAAGPATVPVSLRQRRQQELRQQLSDVATQMFLEHGFDAVRVADVARACGVTEKTVFNHFPTKESLLTDRWDAIIQALQQKLEDKRVAPIDAVLDVFEAELTFLTVTSRQQGTVPLGQVRRFGELVRSTPSLLAHQRRALDQLSGATAVALAERAGTSPEDPEPLIIAAALTGLWTVFSQSLRRHLSLDDPAHIRAGVRQDLRRAADILRRGLDRTQGNDER